MSKVITFHGATLGVSEYSIPALDVAVVGGEVQFLTAGGVLAFDEEAPTPTSYLQTGDILLEGSAYSVPRLYLKGQIASTMQLTTVARMQGLEYTQQYTVPNWPWAETQPRTLPLARGLQGSAWSFKLEGSGTRWNVRRFEIAVGQVLRTR